MNNYKGAATFVVAPFALPSNNGRTEFHQSAGIAKRWSPLVFYRYFQTPFPGSRMNTTRYVQSALVKHVQSYTSVSATSFDKVRYDSNKTYAVYP